ncbi:MAG TPA: LysM peptidoglycan-binding domain-containing protein [Bacteroidetes bacterium]|nr:LysM peptidoglycan-binding domain-containing protein [Bacteroidota bacterium]
MKTKRFVTVLLVSVLAVLLLASISFGQEAGKIRMDAYRIQLADWQKREADARTKIDQLQKDIEGLNREIAGLTTDVDNEWTSIYQMLGADKAAVDTYRRNLDDLESQVDGLSALSSEELFQRRDEIKTIEEKLAGMKKNKIYLLSEMQDKVATIEGKLMRLKNKLPKSIYDNYTVLHGDYLWRISKKPDIYSDPMQWMKIYTYNREMIKNPDLIYPDWILKIPRQIGPNEYMVVKGDFLRKIASNPDVFGDPAGWTKIYEANKGVISDPNTIYPYQIFVIPKN